MAVDVANHCAGGDAAKSAADPQQAAQEIIRVYYAKRAASQF